MAFNVQARANFKARERVSMGVWEAMELLNSLVDDSDPDVSHLYFRFLLILDMALQTSMTQIEHLLQTAEAIRRDGKPEWMQVHINSPYHCVLMFILYSRSLASCMI